MTTLSPTPPRRAARMPRWTVPAAAGALLIIIGGCATFSQYLPGGRGESHSSYEDREYETDAATGKRVVKRETVSRSKVKHPANAKSIGAATVGPLGVSSDGSENYEVELSMAQSGAYHWAAIVCFVGAAAVAYFFKSYVFAGMLAVVGLICMFANSIIATVGPVVNFLVIGCIVAGVIYLIGKYVMGIDFKKRAWAAHNKLMGEGKANEATAALRVGNPDVDRHYVKKGAGDGNKPS